MTTRSFFDGGAVVERDAVFRGDDELREMEFPAGATRSDSNYYA